MMLGCIASVLDARGAWKVEAEAMEKHVDQLDDAPSTVDAPASGALYAWRTAPDAAAPRPYLNGDPMSDVEGLIGEVLLHYGLRKGDYGGGRPSSS